MNILKILTFLLIVTFAHAKTMYLTFDDGPVYGTENILQVISEEKVPAAMFFIGKHIIRNKRNQSYYKSAQENPYVLIGNHTHTHASGRYRKFYSQDPRYIVEDIQIAHEILSKDGLVKKIPYTRLAGRNVYRLPSIEKNDIFISKKQSLNEIDGYDAVWNAGFYLYGWDYEWEFDYKNKRPARTVNQLVSIIERLYRKNKIAKNGKFVLLMHDQMFKNRYNGKQNLRQLIQKLRNNGWEFDSLANYLTPNDFLYATNMPKNQATPLQKLATKQLALPKKPTHEEKVATLSKVTKPAKQKQKMIKTKTIQAPKEKVISTKNKKTKKIIKKIPQVVTKKEPIIKKQKKINYEKLLITKSIDTVTIQKTPTKKVVKKEKIQEVKKPIQIATISKKQEIQRMPLTKEELKKELFEAIKYTDEKRIVTALKNGANIYCFNELGQSPLVLATSLKQSNIVQILINHGADINHKDKNGDSAISILQKMTQ